MEGDIQPHRSLAVSSVYGDDRLGDHPTIPLLVGDNKLPNVICITLGRCVFARR